MTRKPWNLEPGILGIREPNFMISRSYSYPLGTIEAAIKGYLSGKTQRAIGEVLGIPRTTLREWISSYRDGVIGLRDTPEHCHYWVLPPPQGPSSIGTCKVCFAERVFRNSFQEGSPWRRPKHHEPGYGPEEGI